MRFVWDKYRRGCYCNPSADVTSTALACSLDPWYCCAGKKSIKKEKKILRPSGQTYHWLDLRCRLHCIGSYWTISNWIELYWIVLLCNMCLDRLVLVIIHDLDVLVDIDSVWIASTVRGLSLALCSTLIIEVTILLPSDTCDQPLSIRLVYPCRM